MSERLNAPQISVVMCAHNRADMVGQAIESILNQDFQDFELIIIEGGSGDNTWEIINQFNDHRLVLMRQFGKNTIGHDLNRAISVARGQYIARMDDDDIALPHRLSYQWQKMQQNPHIALLGGGMQCFGNREYARAQNYNFTDILAEFLFNSPLSHPTYFMRADFLRHHGIFYPESTPIAEDYAMILAHLSQFNEHHQMVVDGHIILNYRIHDGRNARHNFDPAKHHHIIAIYQDFFQKWGFSASDAEILRHKDLIHRPEIALNNVQDIQQLASWITRLINHNMKNPIFPKDQFRLYAMNVLYNHCRRFGINSLNINGQKVAF